MSLRFAWPVVPLVLLAMATPAGSAGTPFPAAAHWQAPASPQPPSKPDPAPPPVDPALRKTLTDYLAAHHRTPEDYVVDQFKDHDLVFLGERHVVKQPLRFVQRLIPRLYKAGVRHLAYKMAETFDQAAIDSLLTATTYDNDAALTLAFHWDPQNGWAFQEYADVFRAAWELNHGLPKGAPTFRILAIDYRPDWSLVKPEDPIVNMVTRNRAWAGSIQITRNVTMADLIMRELVDKKYKAVIYGGGGGPGGHTPLLPTIDSREPSGLRFSLAHLLHRRIGDRITTVGVRGSITQYPQINQVVAALPATLRAIGFDVKGSPVGDMPLPEALAARLISDKRPLTYADEIGGFALLNQPDEPVTLAPGFLTESLVEQAKRDGWLPNVPSVTLEWIQGNADRILHRPTGGPGAH